MDAEKIRRDIEMYVRSAVTGDERESICVEGLLALMLNVYGNGVADVNRHRRKEIADAKAEQIEVDAKVAEGAKLPEHYQWGWDAIDHFTFGTSRAASEIRAQHKPKVRTP